MLRAIVGIELELTSLSGKWKVTQNRPGADRAGVVDGLSGSADDAATALARRSPGPAAPADGGLERRCAQRTACARIA
jgi:transcriptional regulator